LGDEAWNVRRREYVRRYKARHPERVRLSYKRQNLKKFGITLEEYEERLAAQGGVCLLCSSLSAGKLLAVDHDHQTGAVRGLLCGPCNMALGVLEHRLSEVMSYVSAA